MPTFSIIVPVYNAEKTLRRCLESIRSQTYREYEVLMIENGSTDASDVICSEYASVDTRFILHTCETNCGPSGARNIGLEHTRGEFIAFVDSDDFVEPDYLAVLLQGFAQADVVFFGYRQILTDGTCIGEHLPDVREKEGYYEKLIRLYKQNMFGYTWVKAFRKRIIEQHRFSMELNLLEDEVFTCEVLTEQRGINVIPKPIYNYVTGNAGSLVGRTHQDYCRKVDAAYKAWKKLLANYEKKNEALTGMANAHVSRCMYYGFEREVDVNTFFRDLADTVFFEEHLAAGWLERYLRDDLYLLLSLKRWGYRLKCGVANCIKRSKG